MAELRLGKLPDRARVKITIAVDSDLALALRDDLSDRIWRRRIRRRAHSLHAERISAKRPRLRQSAKGIVARSTCRAPNTSQNIVSILTVSPAPYAVYDTGCLFVSRPAPKVAVR
jgi:hypothetical protein